MKVLMCTIDENTLKELHYGLEAMYISVVHVGSSSATLYQDDQLQNLNDQCDKSNRPLK